MIIGLCGFQSSGKDTVADYLINTHNFIRLSFASILKDIIAIMFNWPRDKLEGLTKEDRLWREQIDPWWSKTLEMPHLTPRYTMQYIGTDLFKKHFHPDIWVKIIENKINNYLHQNDKQNIIVSDCRFENEINMIIMLGGKIIQVHREIPSWFYKYRDGSYPEEIKSIHKSELEWIRCHKDYDIENDGTIEQLYQNVSEIIKYIS
jgi:dephospho-CoA kinase